VKGGFCTDGSPILGCAVDTSCKTVCGNESLNNVSWPMTECDKTAAIPCPGKDVQGSIYRSCSETGWGSPSSANCVNKALLDTARTIITAANYKSIGELVQLASAGTVGPSDVDSIASIVDNCARSLGSILALWHGGNSTNKTNSSVPFTTWILTPYVQAVSNVRNKHPAAVNAGIFTIHPTSFCNGKCCISQNLFPAPYCGRSRGYFA